MASCVPVSPASSIATPQRARRANPLVPSTQRLAPRHDRSPGPLAREQNTMNSRT
jgi:hypothetical protein